MLSSSRAWRRRLRGAESGWDPRREDGCHEAVHENLNLTQVRSRHLRVPGGVRRASGHDDGSVEFVAVTVRVRARVSSVAVRVPIARSTDIFVTGEPLRDRGQRARLLKVHEDGDDDVERKLRRARVLGQKEHHQAELEDELEIDANVNHAHARAGWNVKIRR